MQIPIVITSLDPQITFSAEAEAVVVNAHGCAVQSPAPLQCGTEILLESRKRNSTTGRVVGCVPAGSEGKKWILGVELDTAGNFWGITSPPDDWEADNTTEARLQNSPLVQPSDRVTTEDGKFKLWPFSYGPAPIGLVTPQPVEAVANVRSLVESANALLDDGREPTSRANRSQAELQDEQEQRQIDATLRAFSTLAPQIDEHINLAVDELRRDLAGMHEQIMQTRAEMRGMLAPSNSAVDDDAIAVAVIKRLRKSLDQEISARGANLIEQVESLLQTSADSLRTQLQTSTVVEFASHREEVLHSVETRLQTSEIVHQAVLASMAATRDEVTRQVAELPAAMGAKLDELLIQAQSKLQDTLQRANSQLAGAADSAAGRLRDELASKLLSEIEGQKEQLQRVQQETTEQLHRLQVGSEELMAQAALQLERRFEQTTSQLLQSVETRLQTSDAAHQAVLASMAATRNEVTRQVAELPVAMGSKLDELLIQAQSKLQDALEQANSQLSGATAAAAGRLRDELASTLRHQLQGEIEEQKGQLQRVQQESSEQWRRFQLGSEELTAQAALQLERRFQQTTSQLLQSVETRLQASDAAQQAVLSSMAATRDEVTQQVAELPAAMGAKLDELLIQAQSKLQDTLQQANSEISKTADVAARQLRDEVAATLLHGQNEVQEQRVQLQRAQEEAARQFNCLNARSEELTSQVGQQLQHRAEQVISDTLARIHKEMEAELVAAENKRVSEFAQVVQPMLDRAHHDAAGLQALLIAVQDESGRAQTLTQEVSQQIAGAESFLRSQEEQLRSALHDALLDAVGQLKGRTQQVLESAEAALERTVAKGVEQLNGECADSLQQVQAFRDCVPERLEVYVKELQVAINRRAEEDLADALTKLRQAAEEATGHFRRQSQTAIVQALERVTEQIRSGTVRD